MALAFTMFYPIMGGYNIGYRMVKHRKSRLIVLALALVAMPALAATVKVQPRPDYTRILFTFAQPTSLQLGGGGDSLVLTFDQPVGQSMPALQPQLAAVASTIQQSSDGKQVIIRLKQNYRVRQFTSGPTVGVDILKETTAPEQNILTTKTPVVEPAPETKILRPEPKPAPAAEPSKPKLIKPQEPKPEPILSTKPEPAPAPAPEPAAKSEPILTTKEPTPAPEVKPVEALEPPKPEPQPEPEAPKAEEPAPAPKPVKAEEPAPEPAPEPEPKAEAPKEEEAFSVAKGVDTKTFMVTAQRRADGTIIDFPWTGRTAAAVFERADDIWIVFSEEANANADMLRTVMPKTVTRLEQFAYSGHTVLRLTTDGSIHAAAQQPKGSYGWQILLSNQKPGPGLDTPITGEQEQKKTFLQLSVFDASEALRFYDPSVGDLLVVVPTYEVGRGVSHARDLPEFSIFATQQGIALTSKREDIKVERSPRLGVRVMGDTSLAVSRNLPVIKPDAAPVPGVSAVADVMMPYDQWYVAPEDFYDTYLERLQAMMSATPTQVPGAIERIVELYLGAGLAAEAKGYLDQIAANYPEFYRDHKLALLHAATNVMLNHMDDAANDLIAPELVNLDEANLWRAVPPLFTPQADIVTRIQEEAQKEETGVEDPNAVAEQGGIEQPPPPPEFDFLHYNKSYIRFYPPRIRQRLAVVAADNYITRGQPEKALAIYDTLNADGILDPVQQRAELTIGMVAEKKEKTKEALKIYDDLAKQHDDMYVQARARLEAALLRYNKGMLPSQEATEELEAVRLLWRGDKLERRVLLTLAQMYRDNKQYDATLRSWKTLITAFPNDPDILTISGDMAQLFEELFLNGLADEMPPLKSLALFYEFRELTPIGERGDTIIQKLADRLAAVDLLDRATQLLEHQIKFRVSGEARAAIGARLALLHLLNKQPKRALEVMEITNYGSMPEELRQQRLQLTAKALDAVGKSEEALGLLFHDQTEQGALLRLDVLWHMQDWPNVINQAEDILAARSNLTDPLNPQETEVLLKLALAYSFEGDYTQLRYLRDYYMGLLPSNRYKEIFDFITNDTTPLDAEDFALLSHQITRTESFLNSFREKIAAGRLSEAIK